MHLWHVLLAALSLFIWYHGHERCMTEELVGTASASRPAYFDAAPLTLPGDALMSTDVAHAWNTLEFTLDVPAGSGLSLWLNDNRTTRHQYDIGCRGLQALIGCPGEATHTHLSPYDRRLVTVESSAGQQAFRLVKVEAFEPRFVALLLVGVLLASHAQALARSLSFRMLSAGILSSLVSVLLVLFIIGRQLGGRRSAGVIFAAAGSGLLYRAQQPFDWLSDTLQRSGGGFYLLIALATFGLIGAGYAYMQTPSEKALNLLQWALQLVAFVLIYLSTQLPALSAALVFGTYLHCYPPAFCRRLSTRVESKLFPRRRQLKSVDEFEADCAETTSRELEALREGMLDDPHSWLFKLKPGSLAAVQRFLRSGRSEDALDAAFDDSAPASFRIREDGSREDLTGMRHRSSRWGYEEE
eukprot:PLAT8253.1.p1 GENE.PLAT8253.1~~PLAT8253.1.p1  ORF type:complete len:413 (+),score=206.18 PLAT8253.1:56-1294(+)